MFNDEEYYIDKIYKEFGKPSGLISITSLKYSNIRLRLHHSCVNKTDSVYLKGFLVDGIDEFEGEKNEEINKY